MCIRFAFIYLKTRYLAPVSVDECMCMSPGRVPPLHRGAAAFRQVIFIHLVQPTGSQTKVLQKTRKADVFGGGTAMQGGITGISKTNNFQAKDLFHAASYRTKKQKLNRSGLLVFWENCEKISHKSAARTLYLVSQANDPQCVCYQIQIRRVKCAA